MLSVSAPSAVAQSETSGILVSAPLPSLAHDTGLGERPERLAEPAATGPRRRGAWRGAKIGVLAGLVVGVAGTAVVALTSPCQLGNDYICDWHVAAAAAIPFTVLTTVTGAVIGSATARSEVVPPAVLE